MADKDFYEILGVAKNAGEDEIKKSYRKLAMQHHPDRNKNNKLAEKKFKEASAAYEILKDSQKRAAYDQYGHDAFLIEFEQINQALRQFRSNIATPLIK